MARKWGKFPHTDASYAYAGAALKKSWSRLHQGDREPFPKDAAVADAWRQFHVGAFQHGDMLCQGPGVLVEGNEDPAFPALAADRRQAVVGKVEIL